MVFVKRVGVVSMNYFEQVAQILNVELNEEFNIYSNNRTYKLTRDGLLFYDDYNKFWDKDYIVFDEILCGREPIIKNPILTRKEKEYLSYVIKPFRKEIRSIMKVEYDEEAYIQINFHNYCDTSFPFFENDTMYKGMEADKEYSLEDLRL